MSPVQWVKIVSCMLLGAFSVYLFVMSCGVDYRILVAREHVKFRQEMPTMDSWINSPFGKLKNYVFNITNAAEFKSGRDKRLKVQEIGPITYRIVGYNDILERNATNVRYAKHRYHVVEFLPEESIAPDVLNWTITSTNNVLLGSAAKLKYDAPLTAFGFDSIFVLEDEFVTNSIYWFLWEYTRPLLKGLSRISSLSANVAVLHNALKDKDEVYSVKIGPEHGLENFFRIDTLNGAEIIQEQMSQTRRYSDSECPFNVSGALDNSLYPPFVQPDTPLQVVAVESCRVLPLTYNGTKRFGGLDTYRYTLLPEHQKPPKCLDTSYGYKLYDGMFDVSKCVINGAPSAFSMPHFFGSGYNWSQHYEGYTPNVEDHQAYILLEPVTGIPVSEKYRFQSNIPIPDLTHFSTRLKRYSHMMLPSFWYEFDMGELPGFVLTLMWININVVPHMQPVCMTLFILVAVWSALKAIRVACGDLGYAELYHKICGDRSSNMLLETKFQPTNPAKSQAGQLSDLAVK
ncbi:hypothetical protein KR009_002707 [Drosophila setifemur]|nr:hypothetical protein KR009_002707 [Drosophila setifemur]